MPSLRESIARLHASLRRTRVEREMDDELQFHLDKLTEKYVAAGMAPDDARRAALIAFGGRTRTKDDARDQLLHHAFEDIRHDLRYALRMVWRFPAFTAVAVLSLALGIGANTAVFSVVNAVILRPLPYEDPERLVSIRLRDPDHPDGSTFSVADFLAVTENARSFSAVGGHWVVSGGVTMTGRGDPVQVPATRVTSGLISALGVPPLHGRIGRPEEDRIGAERVVVLSHRFWRDRFAESPAALGQALTLDGAPYTIVGVMPPGFTLPNRPNDQIWPSLQLDTPTARAPYWIRVTGKLAPGVPLEQAVAELAVIAADVRQRYPSDDAEWSYIADDLKTRLVGDSRATVLILYAAVALILLMASANVANLSLARAVTRAPELALRSALGASRQRIVRQLLTESLVIATIGGALGLLLAYVGTDLLAATMPAGIPRFREIRIDGWVLAFTTGIAVLTGIGIGLVPALHVAGAGPGAEMREGARGGSPGRRHRRFASALIVSEFALALTVLVCAGLAISSLRRLQRVDTGAEREGLLVVRVALPDGSYAEEARVDAFFDDVMRRVGERPGVSSVAVSMAVPPHRLAMTNPYTPEGLITAPGTSAPLAEVVLVSPGYFATLGIPVRQGRGFADADREGAPPVAIVNETLARRAFAASGGEALGRWVQLASNDPSSTRLSIVGIVPDVKYQGLNTAAEPTIYVPYKQNLWWRTMYILVRSTGDPMAQVDGVRAAIAANDPAVALREVQTMEQLVGESVAEPRYVAQLLGAFGLLGLILAGAGIYGVLSYNVSQRTRETGIRLALGATRGAVMGLVIRDGMKLAVAGVALGLVLALVTTRLLQSLLFEVSPLDPVTYAATASFLIVVGLLACAIPARRASRTDPMTSIRSDG